MILTKEYKYNYKLNADSLQEVITQYLDIQSSEEEIESPYIRIDVIERLLTTYL